MHAGRLRDQITVMNSVPVRTPSGDVKPEWQEGKTVWAEVKGISGREIISAGAEKAEATVRVWVRYRSDISAASRLNVKSGAFKGLTLEVTGPPIPDAGCTQLEILCKQGVKP
ncbi:phage head closure protein [Kosakonia cowanii]|jgi:SPP1 family predicted phage head-tail adaptor|uniref:phage head closure protein n=1 Tax=Kosakonia cowanii TaxID=208223 RepID=UPI0028A054B7|nr:phage head closure protein [Kosakonia cowanii]